jgi:cell division protein FtsB
MYHLLHGNRGLFALFEIRKVVGTESCMLGDIETRRAFLSQKIRLLRPENLDIDMLEEQARAVLNVANENEVIVNTGDILPNGPSSDPLAREFTKEPTCAPNSSDTLPVAQTQ